MRAVLIACGLDSCTATALSHHPRVMQEIRQGLIPRLWQEIIPDLLKEKASRNILERGITLCLKAFSERRPEVEQEVQWSAATERWQRRDAIWELVLHSAPRGTLLTSFREADLNQWIYLRSAAVPGDPDGYLWPTITRTSSRRADRGLSTGEIRRGVAGSGPTRGSDKVKLEEAGWVPVAGYPGILPLAAGRGVLPPAESPTVAESQQSERWCRPLGHPGPRVGVHKHITVVPAPGTGEPQLPLRRQHDWRAKASP
eukprot:gene9683-5442_t